MVEVDAGSASAVVVPGRLPKLPRVAGDADYTADAAARRRGTAEAATGVSLDYLSRFSFEPALVRNNTEGFVGATQVPLGLAGPLLVDGDYARGEFYVPLATTEGTLVASYNRGMRLTREAGGIRTTVVEDAMQRAPVFVFEDARAARAFRGWVEERRAQIAAAAEATTRVGRLLEIDQYQVGKLRWLRMNFDTGDAAGQNMVTRAARAACEWIVSQRPPGLVHYQLSGQLETDKKSSAINALRSRGKRVVAEVTLPKELLREVVHATPQQLMMARGYANAGALLAGAPTNANHVANAIAALFIACGQDVANVAESGIGLVYAELTSAGDVYYSLTLPSLIVATHGGGTALPTQRECLELLGCDGDGDARKLAEIAAATALCGEFSLGAAVVSDDWVGSHERYGRNR